MATNTPTKPGAQPRYQVVSHPTFENRTFREKKGSSKPRSPAAIIASELGKFFDHRYGTVIPGVVDDVEIMISVMARTRCSRQRIDQWLALHAPWYDDEDAIDRLLDKPIWLTTEAIAKRIGITAEIRKRLGIKMIGACDKTKKQRAADREAEKVAVRRTKRREAGAQPQEEVRRLAIINQKPWIAMGISHRTWYRKHRHPKPEERAEGRVLTFGTEVTPNPLSLRSGSRLCQNRKTSLTVISSL